MTLPPQQTLVELDCDFLVCRLAERHVKTEAAAIAVALPEAWRIYDAACTARAHPWHLPMHAILERAKVQVGASERDTLVEWLYSEQPTRNLCRRPIPSMIELVRKIVDSGIKVVIVSNSEGGLEQLIGELGWRNDFACIADSGRLGLAKPDPGIFAWTGQELGLAPAKTTFSAPSWVQLTSLRAPSKRTIPSR